MIEFLDFESPTAWRDWRDFNVCEINHAEKEIKQDLCLHTADGFALGAAVATGQVTVQVIIFFAVILHKVGFPPSAT